MRTALVGSLLLGCGSDSNGVVPGPVRSEILSIATATSVDLCRLQGSAARRPGVYGTDLGFSLVVPGSDRLVLLFGDTWKSSTSVCDYPPRKSDDLQATLPAVRPAVLGPGTTGGSAQSVCSLIEEPPPDASDPATPRPIRLFPNASDNSDSAALYMDFGRTPLAGFSDGVHAVALFVRNEPEPCDVDADCSGSLICTKDPAYTGKPLGECSPSFNLSAEPAPAICRLDAGGNGDCGIRRTCVVPARGVCRGDKPFVIDGANGPVSPPWYDEDARRAMAQTLYIASSAWPDRPEDYATGARFVTSKFVNPVVRTVRHFDARDPTKNDYSPGSHTLLMWGRPMFWGRKGFQPLLFLLHQSLDGFMDEDGTIHWTPSYFAGYGGDGKPKWSQDESEAVPVYGAEAAIGEAGGVGSVSEFDIVSQLTMSYVEPLGRWVMLYGGDLPNWIFYDPATDTEIPRLVR
jgi:hypothetical protein